MATHSSTLAWTIHGWRSLVGCSPWGRWELDVTERLHFHFSLSCIGEGNGNPLQCSCLENPSDGGAWWAAVSGVAQSQTRLKQPSSSSSSSSHRLITNDRKNSYCWVLYIFSIPVTTANYMSHLIKHWNDWLRKYLFYGEIILFTRLLGCSSRW